MSNITPTVGRIVYYKSYGTPNGEYKPENRASIITAVHDNETVDLAVFNPTGMFFNQRVKRGEQGGQWDWIPFQKEQSKQETQFAEEIAKNLGGMTGGII